MRLLIVNQYGLPAGRPGITRHGDLGAALVRMGHEVTVLASRFNYLTRSEAGDTPATDHHDGVEFRWLNTGSYSGNDTRRIRSMLRYTVASTWEGVRANPAPHLVLASSPHLLAGLAGIAIARRHRVPLLFEVRDLWPSALVDLGAIRRGGWTHRALVEIERRCYRAADRIIIVPPHAARRVAELGADAGKCVHIPNATTIGYETAHRLPATLGALMDRLQGREVLAYVGAQGVSNDLHTVLAGLDQLRSTNPSMFAQVALVLVGDGGEHRRLVERAHRLALDNVHFHPPVGKETIPTLLARADFLLVSFADAPVYEYGLSPNKLFDYMAAGRPVLLASRLDDTPVSEAGAGRVYRPGSSESLAAELVALLSSSADERQAMGNRGKRIVQERYTISSTAVQLDALMRAVTRAAA